MTFLLSTIFSSIILSSCMILLFDFIIYKHWKINSKLFLFFLLLILIKICFPIETKLSIRIPFDRIMNPLIDILLKKVLNLHVYQILLLIILTGSIFQGIHFIKWIKECDSIIQKIKKQGHRINNTHYKIYQCNFINAPLTIGLQGIILLPADLSKKEFDLAMQHETIHIKNKDNWIKFFFNILLILFWWFIPIHIFKKQLDLYLETRVDQEVTQYMNEAQKIEYLEFLVKTQKKNNTYIQPDFVSNLSFNRMSNLEYRVHTVLNDKPNKKSIPILIGIVFLSLIIVTPYYQESSITKGTYEISEKNAYILLNSNTKQLIVNINQINYLLVIEDPSFFINQIQLPQSKKLYFPKDNLDSKKTLTRWKYRFTSEKIQKRKFDACKNQWIGDWKNT